MATGIPPQFLELLDSDELQTIIDILHEGDAHARQLSKAYG